MICETGKRQLRTPGSEDGPVLRIGRLHIFLQKQSDASDSPECLEELEAAGEPLIRTVRELFLRALPGVTTCSPPPWQRGKTGPQHRLSQADLFCCLTIMKGVDVLKAVGDILLMDGWSTTEHASTISRIRKNFIQVANGKKDYSSAEPLSEWYLEYKSRYASSAPCSRRHL